MNDEDEFDGAGDPEQDGTGEDAGAQDSEVTEPVQISPEAAESLKELGVRWAEINRTISEPIAAYTAQLNKAMGSGVAAAIAAQIPKMPVVQLPVPTPILESLTANMTGAGLAAATLARMSKVPVVQLPVVTIPPQLSPSLVRSLTANLTSPAAGIAASIANVIPPGTFYSRLVDTSAFSAGLSSLAVVPSVDTSWASAGLTSLTAQLIPPGTFTVGPLLDTRWASAGLTAWTASLMGPGLGLHDTLNRIIGQFNSLFTDSWLREFDVLRTRFLEWIPENLREVRADRWPRLERISIKDGACLVWAPRAEIVVELVEMRHSKDRWRYLVGRRLEVVEDIEASLKEVDHPDLVDLLELTLQAADCIREGRYAPAQALLGNVLDTAMSAHGKDWLRSSFPQATFPGTNSHKMIAGAHGSRADDPEVRMLVPSLIAAGMKNTFLGPHVERQHTFNRHLGAHKASADSYRTEFALAALLNTQALLRVLDRYLYANTAP